ncbi:microsomal signal peptidase 12 kDa subunit [Plasmodium vivax India VII]|uniref:Microsomal signal peptidase 12 kDa subunit, putative n=5 Tax=Plasmodium vivax TaxID=5855 RepID=A5K0R3_PLAVS|nr:microsomal signal peptidase 12 kDa subunit, putative [Plasmodium vivax]KMZ78513.1 microsomal signal peptidase 12 kDa subunit [Plasmodium vivax India VII]KMZ83700.1 microsomal signal peptidase 12 kDa subunit [Plasmodium vivax Brazil I]KMZ90899.1 microsomal signal peptidase 12 kDa subunit [Plasmodium vivax Mauritania I]KMZ97681.1 microsomal signal peptidase 12 kDa subunit [Plasmodium vivax North Korean]EDL46910.1 microsomal signal peptidase 12 kDa subunit, putative [Plasmodium vivax]|eukprot:XP_001616637.1 microsomal signal peptidase 12 kDa subunit [Plasmodium vivax Sal-1]
MGLISAIKNSIERTYVCVRRNHMDFHGQKLAFLIKNVVFTISTVVSIAVGYYKQNLALSAYIILGGTALSALVGTGESGHSYGCHAGPTCVHSHRGGCSNWPPQKGAALNAPLSFSMTTH